MKAHQFVLAAVALVSTTDVAAFVPTYPAGSIKTYHSGLYMAIDYNDPLVAAEFANVQPMDFDDVEAELRAKGIPVSATITYVYRNCFCSTYKHIMLQELMHHFLHPFCALAIWKLN